MKFTHEEKKTPTLRQWVDEAARTPGTRYPIIRVFANDEWRTITFVTDEFKFNIKYGDKKEYERIDRELGKILLKHCRAGATYTGEYQTEVEIVPASDADESPQLFKRDNLGYVSA